jgi:hypothetical protein
MASPGTAGGSAVLPWSVDLTGVVVTDVLPDDIAVAGTPSASTT